MPPTAISPTTSTTSTTALVCTQSWDTDHPWPSRPKPPIENLSHCPLKLDHYSSVGWVLGTPARGGEARAATSLGSGAPPGALGPLRGLPSLQLAARASPPRTGSQRFGLVPIS